MGFVTCIFALCIDDVVAIEIKFCDIVVLLLDQYKPWCIIMLVLHYKTVHYWAQVIEKK